MVDGAPALKPGRLVADTAKIDLAGGALAHVSRAGLKLAHGLDRFAIDPAGLVCLDIGASTGGFTEVLLERGASRVYAVDVGTGQLAPEIAADARVVDLSATDARALTRDLVPEPIGLIVVDVSFISLAKALPAALALARPGARLVCLVKPQFELGPGAVGGDGVVHDATARRRALDEVCRWLAEVGWTVAGHVASAVFGKSGNREWLVHAVRGEVAA